MQKVIGLAGHIDHGKTALVKALTGVDTDRLEEEKRRGVTIDIGIAFYNDTVTFIDVPGHEKFIKNMVTGVSTVDAALLVIAADDGVMPQTREHLDILHLLGVTKLLVALNKTDLVEPDWLELVIEEVSLFLAERGYPETEVIPVSAVTGAGIEQLRNSLDKFIAGIKPQDRQGVFRLPIDRVFSVKGFGTVVTGTVLSHELRKGQRVELYPQELVYPVRGLQTHHQEVDKIKFGDRGAINLGGASVSELGRGAFLGTPGMFQNGAVWLGLLQVLPHWKRPVKEAERVHIHVGTGKREARVHLLEANQCDPGESMLAQFFFEERVSAGFRERVVVRFLSPQETLGGATLYWAVERRLKKQDRRLEMLRQLAVGELDQLLQVGLKYFEKPLSRKELARLFSIAESRVHTLLQQADLFKIYQERYLAMTKFKSLLEAARQTLTRYHQQQPLGQGLSGEDICSASPAEREFFLGAALAEGLLKNQGNLWQLAGHQGQLDAADEQVRLQIIDLFQATPFRPPSLSKLRQEFNPEEQTILQWMIQHGDLVRMDHDFYLLQDQLDHFLSALRDWFRHATELTVAQSREIIPSTRKFLLPMLNYAERKGLLLRDGDVRRWVGEELQPTREV